MRKNFTAFTLAEVLITLGIIGVVAAMTMPTLMNQTNGAQYKSAYKKALSAIAQGVTLNVALDGGNFADTKVAEGAVGADAITKDTNHTTIAGILGQRMSVVKTDATLGYGTTNSSGVDLVEHDTVLFFNDGSVFAFKNADEACTVNTAGGATAKICEGFIDVNGAKGPNKVVACNGGTGATATSKDTYDENGVKTAEATACEVGNPTDIYPVVFYDQTILPATNAAKAVLYGK